MLGQRDARCGSTQHALKADAEALDTLGRELERGRRAASHKNWLSALTRSSSN